MKLYKFTDLSTGRTETFKSLNIGTVEFDLPKTTVYDRLKKTEVTVIRGIKIEIIYREDTFNSPTVFSNTPTDSTGIVWYDSPVNTNSITVVTNYAPPTESINNRVLVIPDLHIPAEHSQALEFCVAIRDKYKCNKVVCLGDLIDFHATSRFPSDPDGLSAGDELSLAKQRLQTWYRQFPDLVVLSGNHDSRNIKKAFLSGISANWMKGFAEVLGVPNWQFVNEYLLDGVLYVHGDGLGGIRSAVNRRTDKRLSVVQGHLHSVSYIDWSSNDSNMGLFSMQLGCLIDTSHYAMKYAAGGKEVVLNVGVIIDGIPTIIPFK